MNEERAVRITADAREFIESSEKTRKSIERLIRSGRNKRLEQRIDVLTFLVVCALVVGAINLAIVGVFEARYQKAKSAITEVLK